jgi:hypothetical protein
MNILKLLTEHEVRDLSGSSKRFSQPIPDGCPEFARAVILTFRAKRVGIDLAARQLEQEQAGPTEDQALRQARARAARI